MGGALWFFDSNYNFGGQQGRWLNFEWFGGGIRVLFAMGY